MAAEKRYENKIKRYLKENGAWFVKYWGGGRFTKAGVPDLLVCLNGKFLAIEVKADDGEPSELQLYTIKQINDAGGYAFVCYPNDYSDLVVLIEDIKHNASNKTIRNNRLFLKVNKFL